MARLDELLQQIADASNLSFKDETYDIIGAQALVGADRATYVAKLVEVAQHGDTRASMTLGHMNAQEAVPMLQAEAQRMAGGLATHVAARQPVQFTVKQAVDLLCSLRVGAQLSQPIGDRVARGGVGDSIHAFDADRAFWRQQPAYTGGALAWRVKLSTGTQPCFSPPRFSPSCVAHARATPSTTALGPRAGAL